MMMKQVKVNSLNSAALLKSTFAATIRPKQQLLFVQHRCKTTVEQVRAKMQQEGSNKKSLEEFVEGEASTFTGGCNGGSIGIENIPADNTPGHKPSWLRSKIPYVIAC